VLSFSRHLRRAGKGWIQGSVEGVTRPRNANANANTRRSKHLVRLMASALPAVFGRPNTRKLKMASAPSAECRMHVVPKDQ
jgi:hypothetical protein